MQEPWTCWKSKITYRVKIKIIKHDFRLGKQTDGPLRGVLPTIRYLQRLGLDYFELVLQYSRWVLEKDPKHGMDVISK